MQLELTLMFNGNCREAFAFYAETLGGKIGFVMSYGESPMAGQHEAAHHAKVMHATLRLGNLNLVGGDVLTDYKPPQGFSILLQPASAEQGRAFYERLGVGGQIVMPLQQTFWSPCYGVLKDRFGVTWEINSPAQAKPMVEIVAVDGQGNRLTGSERAVRAASDAEDIDKLRRKAQAQHHCSFCGKSGSQVKKLVAGPGIFICNECVALCCDVMATELGARAGPKPAGDERT